MRVVLVGPYPQTEYVVRGGVESAVAALSRGLSACDDIEVIIVAPSVNGSASSELRERVRIQWFPRSFKPHSLTYWNLERRRIRRIVNGLAPDLVHYQGIGGWSLDTRRPALLTIHGITERDAQFSSSPLRTLNSKVIEAVERRARRTAIPKVIINRYVEEELRGQLRGELFFIENAVSTKYFHIERRPVRGQFLFLGRINERKNILGLIRSFQAVYRYAPDATLLLAGTVDSQIYWKSCAELINEAGLGSAVKLIGQLDEAEVSLRLSTAHALVLFSHQETAPMVIAEAMAAGVPVIASDTCGMRYMVRSRETGFLVGQGADEQSEAMLRLMSDEALSITMGRSAQVVATQLFSLESVVTRTVAVYRKLIGERSGN